MRSPYYLLLLSASVCSAALADNAPLPSQVSDIDLPAGETAYLIEQDLEYNDQTYFHGYRPGESLELAFKGNTGTESLIFDNKDNITAYIRLEGERTRLLFENLYNVSILNQGSQASDPSSSSAVTLYGQSTLLFNKIGNDVTISGNGGAGYVYGILELSSSGAGAEVYLGFTDIGGDVTISDNYSTRGPIFLWVADFEIDPSPITTAALEFKDIGGSVTISGNSGRGILIDNYFGTNNEKNIDIIFSNIGKGISFINNASSSGGVLYSRNGTGMGQLVFEDIRGGITMRNNESRSHGGVFYLVSTTGSGRLSMNDIEGDIMIADNKAARYGGFIYHGFTQDAELGISNVQGDVTFRNNTAGQGAGALYLLASQGELNFHISNIHGDVLFDGNDGGTGTGGAVFAYGERANILLSADYGNIVFTDNVHKEGIANSLYIMGNSVVSLRAAGDNAVTFFDPIVMEQRDEEQNDTHLVEINKPDGESAFSGKVIFSGENFDPSSSENITSVILGNTIVYDGEFSVRNGASYGVISDDAPLSGLPRFSADSFELSGGVFELIHQGSVAARNISYTGGVVRAGFGGYISAENIDFSRGLSMDFSPFLDNGASGLNIRQAQTVSLGGLFGVADTLDFYTDNRWKDSQKFLALTLGPYAVAGLSGEFDDIISTLTHSSIIESPYTYSGKWSLDYVDTTGDGIFDEIYAVWTPGEGNGGDGGDGGNGGGDGGNEGGGGDGGNNGGNEGGGIKEAAPELKGSLVPNTLWSSMAQLASMKNAALGQLLSQYIPDRNVWAMGLGEFSQHNSNSSTDGYKYSGGGNAVGADTHVTEELRLGLAFGHTYGTTKSRSYNAEVDQTSLIGMLYGEWNHQINDGNAIRINGVASYGLFDNKEKVHFSDGHRNEGSWDNHVFQISLYGNWDIKLDESLFLTPFIGLEYTDGIQKAFTESGDKIRHFEEGRLRNLTMPVGISLTKINDLNGDMKWINSISLSYLPDIYRKSPSSQVTRLSNGFAWESQGVDPSRHAGRLQLNSRLLINKNWSVFAQYTVEGRSDAFYHGANAGVSYSF